MQCANSYYQNTYINMKISIDRESLLQALQGVANVVERRQTLPILGNILLVAEGNELSLTATDMEVESVSRVQATVARPGTLTVPGRKLVDIVRSLPAQAVLALEEKDRKLRLQTGRSRFVLSTLPAAEFPAVGFPAEDLTIALEASTLQELVAATQFAMAHQDVRYYLNGLLLEISGDTLKAVATDGHRLALCERGLIETVGDRHRQLIVPRKGVTEIQRLASHAAGPLTLGFSSNALRVASSGQTITVKLVDGKFPDYERVIPRNGDKIVTAEREVLRSALQRTAILSNEKFRGVRLTIENNLLKASAHNPEQEEAEEEVEIQYAGDPLEIGFNVSYLLDVMSVLASESIQVALSDANSSCLIQAVGDARSRYVVMPMRL